MNFSALGLILPVPGWALGRGMVNNHSRPSLPKLGPGPTHSAIHYIPVVRQKNYFSYKWGELWHEINEWQYEITWSVGRQSRECWWVKMRKREIPRKKKFPTMSTTIGLPGNIETRTRDPNMGWRVELFIRWNGSHGGKRDWENFKEMYILCYWQARRKRS